MTPDDYCQEKAARSGSSFYYSFLFLPPERRRAITALYAFCREVDDVVDETSDAAVAARKLDWWEQEIARLNDGRPDHPVTRALAAHVQAYGLTQSRLLEVIAGMRMDLVQNRYADQAALDLYCRRVAGVVGEMASSIFGQSDPMTLRYADRLGLAFQLTNIIRDVGEDARKGRIYLPQDALRRYAVSTSDLLAARRTEGFTALMTEMTQRARQAYREAYGLLPEADRRAQRPGLIMAAIYCTLLDEIERDGFQVLDRRTSLTPIRKLWLAWRTWVSGRPPAVASVDGRLR
jgi:phytoene synthase